MFDKFFFKGIMNQMQNFLVQDHETHVRFCGNEKIQPLTSITRVLDSICLRDVLLEPSDLLFLGSRTKSLSLLNCRINATNYDVFLSTPALKSLSIEDCTLLLQPPVCLYPAQEPVVSLQSVSIKKSDFVITSNSFVYNITIYNKTLTDFERTLVSQTSGSVEIVDCENIPMIFNSSREVKLYFKNITTESNFEFPNATDVVIMARGKCSISAPNAKNIETSADTTLTCVPNVRKVASYASLSCGMNCNHIEEMIAKNSVPISIPSNILSLTLLNCDDVKLSHLPRLSRLVLADVEIVDLENLPKLEHFVIKQSYKRVVINRIKNVGINVIVTSELTKCSVLEFDKNFSIVQSTNPLAVVVKTY